MRGIAPSLSFFFLVGACGADEVIPDASRFAVDARIDGVTTDGPSQTCTSAAGTASVMTTGGGGGAATYDRLYAGALLHGGPIAPGPGVPSSFSLLFATAPMLDVNTGYCCINDDDACCTIDVLRAQLNMIAAGSEIGTHDVTFAKSNSAFSVAGTVTITSYTSPWDSEPGRIAGSVDATSGTLTVTGTFDNSFCPALLSAEI